MANASTPDDVKLLRTLADMLERGASVKYMLHYQIPDPSDTATTVANFSSNFNNHDEAVGALTRLTQKLVEASQQSVSHKLN